MNRGYTAGIHAAQRKQIRHYHQLRPPAGDEVTVLAGGTAAEALIEALSIGVGAVIQPGLALIVGASIALDNLSEALSIGALIAERDAGLPVRRRARTRGRAAPLPTLLGLAAAAGFLAMLALSAR